MFDNIVYLNRDQDVDRRKVTEEQLERYGARATRFSAITDGLESRMVQSVADLRINFAQASCLVSHLEIIRQYGDRPLLVFEDDIDLSPSEHWGCSLTSILECIPEQFGIAQLYAYPSPSPVMPRHWQVGTFGTVAYYVLPKYAKYLVNTAYIEGKWDVRALKCDYVQPVADSVLYSNSPTISMNLFGLRNTPSTILPHATYVEAASKFGQSWAQGLNNSDNIKEELRSLKEVRR